MNIFLAGCTAYLRLARHPSEPAMLVDTAITVTATLFVLATCALFR